MIDRGGQKKEEKKRLVGAFSTLGNRDRERERGEILEVLLKEVRKEGRKEREIPSDCSFADCLSPRKGEEEKDSCLQREEERKKRKKKGRRR